MSKLFNIVLSVVLFFIGWVIGKACGTMNTLVAIAITGFVSYLVNYIGKTMDKNSRIIFCIGMDIVLCVALFFFIGYWAFVLSFVLDVYTLVLRYTTKYSMSKNLYTDSVEEE